MSRRYWFTIQWHSLLSGNTRCAFLCCGKVALVIVMNYTCFFLTLQAVFALFFYLNCGQCVLFRGVELESELESESLIWWTLRLRTQSISSGLLCNFVEVSLTLVQFILQIKLCLYIVVHPLLEEFKNFSQVIFKYTIMSHNKS